MKKGITGDSGAREIRRIASALQRGFWVKFAPGPTYGPEASAFELVFEKFKTGTE
jgi:hypothetical protein